MSTVLITGAAGLVGSSVARLAAREGYCVVGIDNDMRSYFFGPSATTAPVAKTLLSELPNYTHHHIDIRDRDAVDGIIADLSSDLVGVVHTAAQPSHDWSAQAPAEDFEINTVSTVGLLDATRRLAPNASFVFTSTNKVYGDQPNRFPLVENQTRWDLPKTHRFAQEGIDETLSMDQCVHSPFGASKAAADLIVQEYGRYYGINTTVLRLGCVTGPAHQGAELHGFLSYLVRRSCMEHKYTIYGYSGKQVRDNLHSDDLANAIMMLLRDPSDPGEVYNLGGGRSSSVSVLEALSIVEEIVKIEIQREVLPDARTGDHIWWITDCNAFTSRYPSWLRRRTPKELIRELINSL